MLRTMERLPSLTVLSSSVTLLDIARRLGIGKSTVQRALAGSPLCNEETRRLVKQVAEEMGYRPDPVFAALGSRRERRTGRGVPIAHLVDSLGGPRVGIHYTEYLEQRAEELGYKLETISLSGYKSPRRLWNVLYARGFAGVLASALRAEHQGVLAANTNFPLVCVGRTDPHPFNTVRPAVLLGVHQAWERMRALGYRRIGAAILRHTPMVEDDYSRLAGALASQDLEPAQGGAIPPFTTPLGAPGAVAGFVDWVRTHRPDGVLGFHVGQYYELVEAGFKVPEDVGFACLHLDGMGKLTVDPGYFAGLRQNRPLIARSAVNLLDQMIRHGERGVPEEPITLMVQSHWSDGASLPARIR